MSWLHPWFLTMQKIVRSAALASFLYGLSFELALADPVALKNPLKVGSIEELLSAILGVVIVLATPIVVFFIIYAGFLYVTARGNTQQVQQATTALTYAIIGGLLILGSFALAEVIKNVVDSFSA